jgi:hypothetical protein
MKIAPVPDDIFGIAEIQGRKDDVPIEAVGILLNNARVRQVLRVPQRPTGAHAHGDVIQGMRLQGVKNRSVHTISPCFQKSPAA